MHDPIIMPVTQEETKAELRSRGYSVEIPPPDDEEHEPIIEHHEPPPPDDEELPPPPPIELEHHEPIIEPLPIAEVDDRTQMIAGIIYAAFCVFIDEKHIIKFNW